MAWWSLDLGDAWLAVDALECLHQQWQAFGAHDSVRLWQRHESEGQLHCRLKVYFPPEAERFALFMKAALCVEPSMTGLSELVLAAPCQDKSRS